MLKIQDLGVKEPLNSSSLPESEKGLPEVGDRLGLWTGAPGSAGSSPHAGHQVELSRAGDGRGLDLPQTLSTEEGPIGHKAVHARWSPD